MLNLLVIFVYVLVEALVHKVDTTMVATPNYNLETEETCIYKYGYNKYKQCLLKHQIITCLFYLPCQMSFVIW